MKKQNQLFARFPMRIVSLVSVALAVMPSAFILAQMTARGIGMGGAYTALARGVHAPDWNPANLGLPDNPGFSMTIVSAGVSVENNSVDLDLYNRYAVDSYWDAEEVKNLLSKIPDDGFNTYAKVAARTLSFSAGRFALSIGVDAGADMRLDKTFFNLPLKGNAINTVYSFGNTRAYGLGLASVGFSYAHPIEVSFAKAFALGGTFHFNGGGYAKVEKLDMELGFMDYGMDIHGEYESRFGLGQKGWGIDIGAAAQMDKNWTVGISLINPISSMKWDKKLEDAVSKGYIRGDSLDVFDISENEDDKKDDKEDLIEDTSWTEDGKPFSTKLPVILRAGCAYRDGDVILTADYAQGFEDNAWTNTKPRLALGTEWRGVGWLPLRMGVALGGKIGFGTSYGFGLHPGGFFLDFGILNRGFLFPKSIKGITLAVDMGVGL